MLQPSNSKCSTKYIFYSLIEGAGIPSMIYYMVNGIVDLVAEKDIDDVLSNASLGWKIAFAATFAMFSAFFTYLTYKSKVEEARFKTTVSHRLAALEQPSLGNVNNDFTVNINAGAPTPPTADQSSSQPLLSPSQ